MAKTAWGHALEAMLQPEPGVRHLAKIRVGKPQREKADAHAVFLASWSALLQALQQRGAPITPGGPAAYYWGHLPSGLALRWMGRYFWDPDPARSVYAVLYLIDVPGAGAQTIIATVAPQGGNPSLAMDLATSARLALAEAVESLLASLRGPVPGSPTPLATPERVIGQWTSRVGTPGLDVYHAGLGTHVGAVGTGQTVRHAFGADGRYRYSYTVFNAASGTWLPSHATEAHEGTWSMQGDVIHRQAEPAITRDNRLRVAGLGVCGPADARRRMLILVRPDDGQLHGAALLPDGADCQPNSRVTAWWLEEDEAPRKPEVTRPATG